MLLLVEVEVILFGDTTTARVTPEPEPEARRRKNGLLVSFRLSIFLLEAEELAMVVGSDHRRQLTTAMMMMMMMMERSAHSSKCHFVQRN